jgi:hypothetical protein
MVTTSSDCVQRSENPGSEPRASTGATGTRDRETAITQNACEHGENLSTETK